MKKNLRIVSAAAAALLAVAPVAASAMTVNAADTPAVTAAKSNAITNITLGGVKPAINGDVTVSSNLTAVTKPLTTTINNTTGTATPSNWDGKVSGTVSASWNGQSYTGNLAESSVVAVWKRNNNPANGNLEHDYTRVTPGETGLYHLNPGQKYFIEVTNVSFNFGSANANLSNKTIVGSNGVKFLYKAAPNNNFKTLTDKMTFGTTQNGAMNGVVDMLIPVTPVDTTSTRAVSFYERANGTNVTAGSVELNANSNANSNAQLNVQAVVNAFNAKYAAHQFEGGNQYTSANVTTDVKSVTDQLNKLGMTVDSNGYFTANKSFTLNFEAKSNENAYTATMPVTVSVPNGKEAPAAQETTKTITIMHISTIYDKNGVATHEPALRAYDTYSVVSEPVTLKNKDGKEMGKFYKLAGKDQYIKVGNVDGTKRTLRKNAVIYKSTGKPYMKSKKHRRIVKAGSEHTTYGKSFMIAGHQMYRVGRNQYIKKANF